ncbi:MAG TPA: hypothetical protein VN577_10160 [Terriglobales bacterium]|nr:hypothetical protein [Terriglobales bacterium]
MERYLAGHVTGRINTRHGVVYVHRGYLLGIFEGSYLRPWATLDEATRDNILIELAGSGYEA